MEVVKIELKKIEASEGKVLVRKDWVQEYDEENNPIPRDIYKIVYLAKNDSEDNYEEIDE